MIQGQVREDRRREADRVGAVQLQRVRGDLHHAGLIPSVEHLLERPLQIDRLRRGLLNLVLDPADQTLDHAEQAGLATIGLQQGADQERRSRLGIGGP
jgi:hypothetical protein